MSAACPATICCACEPDGPYDCANETPWPAGWCWKRVISFAITAFGVE